MALFFQFDIREEFGLPLEAGSHLSVYACPLHNDAPEPLPARLPLEFWANTDDPKRAKFKHLREREKASYRLLLHAPGADEVFHDADGVVEHQRLSFQQREDVVLERHHENRPQVDALHVAGYPGLTVHDYDDYTGLELFKVGGHPTALQDMMRFTCCCGAEMVFVCQIPYPSKVFPMTVRSDNLFLDNMVYLFACRDQCNPHAVLATAEN